MMRFFIITDIVICPLLINWFWKLLNHFRYTIKTLLAWATTLIKICSARTLKTAYWGSGGLKNRGGFIPISTLEFFSISATDFFWEIKMNEWKGSLTDCDWVCVLFINHKIKLEHTFSTPPLFDFIDVTFDKRAIKWMLFGVPPRSKCVFEIFCLIKMQRNGSSNTMCL